METKRGMMRSAAVLAATPIAFWLVVGVGGSLVFPDRGSAGSTAADTDESGGSDPVIPADGDELPPETDCANALDDNGDGLIDCADPRCQLRACDDDNLCTTGDTCQDQVCVGQPVNCSTTDLCTLGVCDAQNGQCVNQPVSCDDGNPCTADLCDPQTGCENPASDEAVCDDGDPSTLDACVNGDCVSSPVP